MMYLKCILERFKTNLRNLKLMLFRNVIVPPGGKNVHFSPYCKKKRPNIGNKVKIVNNAMPGMC